MIPSKSPLYDILSWEDIYVLCQDIVRKVQVSGYNYDAILAVARGGFVPACIVANQLGIRNVFSVSLRRTDSDRQEAELITPEVVGLQPDILRDKDRILVVDDIVDKGGISKMHCYTSSRAWDRKVRYRCTRHPP
ncbi:MAG: phosphoribosyltransferase [Candidatus Dojkabacteria bacterium]